MVPTSPPLSVSALQSLSSASSVDFSVLSSLQPSCPETTALLGNPSLQVVSMPYGESSVLCDLSTSSPRPMVPVSLRRQVFDDLHNLYHPGVCPTRRLILRTFVCSGLSNDVSNWARGCLHCQQSKVQKHVYSSVLRFLLLLDGSVTFKWTSFDLFLVPEVPLISSPSWIGPLVGPRLFLYHQPTLRIVLEL